MIAEDLLSYAIMSLETRPVAAAEAICAIRVVLLDIGRLRTELAVAERSAVLARGALALAREELSRVGTGVRP